MLLPSYARDAIAAAARVLAAQDAELTRLTRAVVELRAMLDVMAGPASAVNAANGGDMGGPVLVHLQDNPRRVTFTRVQPGQAAEGEG
jgi:hypothetical protein